MSAALPLAAASSLRPEAPILVSVCTTCRAGEELGPGPALLGALREALTGRADVVVRAVQCLGVCKRPATAAVSAPDGYTFIFGDLDAEEGAAALTAFADSYARTDHGYVPWRERAPVLRRGLVARLPPASWSPEDGRNPG